MKQQRIPHTVKGYVKIVLTFFLVIFLFCLILLHSCHVYTESYKNYNSDEWLTLHSYAGEAARYLGKNSEDILMNIYSLNGMPTDSFLYLSGGVFNYETVVMNRKAKEPLLQYDITKIEIQKGDQCVACIEEQGILQELLSLRRNEAFIGTGNVDSYDDTFTMILHFNLPCDLLHKSIIYADGNNLYWQCRDIQTDSLYIYNVTALFNKQF